MVAAMNLKAVIAAAAVCTTAFGGVATAEAKPHDMKLKDCKQSGKKLHCKTQGGKDVTGACSSGYQPVQLVELPPGNETSDLNGNFILCYSETLGVTDDVAS
jgi:hypothetical protein